MKVRKVVELNQLGKMLLTKREAVEANLSADVIAEIDQEIADLVAAILDLKAREDAATE